MKWTCYIVLSLTLFACAVPTETLDRRRLSRSQGAGDDLPENKLTPVPGIGASCDVPPSKFLNPRKAFKKNAAVNFIPPSCCLALSETDLSPECLALMAP